MRNLDIKYIFQSLIALLTIAFFVVGGILVSRTLAPEGYPEEPSILDRRFGDVVIETLVMVLLVVAFYGVYRYMNKKNKKKYPNTYSRFSDDREAMDAFLNPHDPILNPQPNSKTRPSEE